METVLNIRRKWFTPESTIGELFIDNSTERECFTLEDMVRTDGVKVPGQTAIPEGRYEISFYNSAHQHGLVPLLQDVPGFTYIEIHPGNSPIDTLGCILVGEERPEDQPNLILNSRRAFNALMPKVEMALRRGKVFVSIYGQTV